MMYGTVETVEERLEHLFRLRELQDETGGFTAFITWSYQPEHTELGGGEATGIEYLRTLAIARIVLDNFDNLQASWVTQGGKVGQLSLAYGANDMGSVMIEENVVRAAGASYCMDEIEIVRNIENAGFARRSDGTCTTRSSAIPIFRERAVPRMLELAVARAEGDTSRAPEVDRYAARSAGEKRRRSGIAAPERPMMPVPSRLHGCCPSCKPPIARRLRSRCDDGRIVAVGRLVEIPPPSTAPSAERQRHRRSLRTSLILPGLVNAHAHLELSWMRGQVLRAASMPEWAAR